MDSVSLVNLQKMACELINRMENKTVKQNGKLNRYLPVHFRSIISESMQFLYRFTPKMTSLFVFKDFFPSNGCRDPSIVFFFLPKRKRDCVWENLKI